MCSHNLTINQERRLVSAEHRETNKRGFVQGGDGGYLSQRGVL